METVLEPESIQATAISSVLDEHYALAKFDKVISVLYACVQNEKGFSAFLECYRKEFQMANAALICMQEAPFRSLYGWASGYPKGLLLGLIKTRMLDKDDAIVRAMQQPLNAPRSFSGGDESYDFFEHMTPVSKAWAKPLGLCDSASNVFSLKENERYILIANRSKKVGIFSEADLEILERLQPHIQQAVMMHEAFHKKNEMTEGLKAAVETISHPSALYSPFGKLLSTNQLFKDFGLEYKLFEVNSELEILEFHCADAGDQFQAVLNLYLNDIEEEKPKKEYLFLESNGRLLRLIFRPMLSPKGVLKTLFIEAKNPAEAVNVSLQQIQGIIECSDAESRVVLGVLQGQDNNEIAENLCLSVNTVRSYVKSVMRKNDFHRQIDMVSLLMKSLY